MQKYEIYLKIEVADNEPMKADNWKQLAENIGNYVKEYINKNRVLPGFMTTEFIETPKVSTKTFYKK
jgi:hypothetical protein